MKMTHKHDVYFSPHSTEAHSLVMQIADYCNKRGIWYKISESTLGIGIVYGGNVGYVIDADRKIENNSEKPNNCEEPSDECKKCKHLKHISNYGWDCEFEFFEDCNYEPKDEPQIECENCKHYGTHHPCELDFKACRYEPKDEPQTDCAWR